MPDYVLPLAAFAGGLCLLAWGGDRLVRHAAHLAVSYRVPKTVVGAVVLGFGTSLPELFVSVLAALEGSPALAIGNVVGSNIANVGLILGVGALLTTLHVQRWVLRVDLPLGVLAALFLWLYIGPADVVDRTSGLILLGAFVFYLLLSLRFTQRHRADTPADPDRAKPEPGKDLLWIVVGLVSVAVGARILIYGAVELAEMLGVSKRIIGLTVVALGTSLPELAAIIAAARRSEADLAVGNVAGSNLFNLLFVLGTTAVIRDVPVAELMTTRDFPALIVFALLAFPLMASGRRLRRTQGLLMLAAYLAYVALTWGQRG